MVGEVTDFVLQRACVAGALCVLGAVAVAEPPAQPPQGLRSFDASQKPATFDQQLLGAFPADENLPRPQLVLVMKDVVVAEGVKAHSCVVSVPSQLVFSQDPAADAGDTDQADWILTTPTTQEADPPPTPRVVYIQFWCVRLTDLEAAGEKLPEQLQPVKSSGGSGGETVHLGNGADCAVFVNAPYLQWPAMRQRLGLTGGANVIDVTLGHLEGARPGSDIAERFYAALAEQGDHAIPAANRLISEDSDHRDAVIEAMGAAETPAITQWLIGLTTVDDKDIVRAAQKALLAKPRPEAVDLYVAWLTEWAGKASVEAEILACAAVGAKAAIGPLNQSMAQPYNIREYLLALKTRRQLEDRPVNDDLRDNAGQLVDLIAQDRSLSGGAREEINEVMEQITTNGDIEATAAIAVELALAEAPSRRRKDTLNKAGVYILAQLPPKQRLQMVDHLAAKSCQPSERRQLRTLGIRVKAAAAKPKAPPTAKQRD